MLFPNLYLIPIIDDLNHFSRKLLSELILTSEQQITSFQEKNIKLNIVEFSTVMGDVGLALNVCNRSGFIRK